MLAERTARALRRSAGGDWAGCVERV